MPRYNVEYKGRWACFSSIVDDFISSFMNQNDYEEWRKNEYGKDYSPLGKCNMATIHDATWSIRLNRTHDKTIQSLQECGLSEIESHQILREVERRHYSPKYESDGKYHCPNCYSEVELNQESCKDKTCCLEFTWIDMEPSEQ